MPVVSPVPYPLPPMAAVSTGELPVGAKWVYEPKFDGFRCLAHAASGRVRLQSRQLRSLTRYFPEIVAAVAELGEDVVLDGELIWGSCCQVGRGFWPRCGSIVAAHASFRGR